MKEPLAPWLTPEDTSDAFDLLRDVAEILTNTAKYASIRRDLRFAIEAKAKECLEFVNRGEYREVERSLLKGLERIAEKRKMTVHALIVDALEVYVSRASRGE